MSAFQVLVSDSAKDLFHSLDDGMQERIRKGFAALAENPFMHRSGADIKKLKGSSNPSLYRLRVGDYRLIYCIIGKEVKVTSIIPRGKGYAWLD